MTATKPNFPERFQTRTTQARGSLLLQDPDTKEVHKIGILELEAQVRILGMTLGGRNRHEATADARTGLFLRGIFVLRMSPLWGTRIAARLSEKTTAVISSVFEFNRFPKGQLKVATRMMKTVLRIKWGVSGAPDAWFEAPARHGGIGLQNLEERYEMAQIRAFLRLTHSADDRLRKGAAACIENSREAYGVKKLRTKPHEVHTRGAVTSLPRTCAFFDWGEERPHTLCEDLGPMILTFARVLGKWDIDVAGTPEELAAGIRPRLWFRGTEYRGPKQLIRAMKTWSYHEKVRRLRFRESVKKRRIRERAIQEGRPEPDTRGSGKLGTPSRGYHWWSLFSEIRAGTRPWFLDPWSPFDDQQTGVLIRAWFDVWDTQAFRRTQAHGRAGTTQETHGSPTGTGGQVISGTCPRGCGVLESVSHILSVAQANKAHPHSHSSGLVALNRKRHTQLVQALVQVLKKSPRTSIICVEGAVADDRWKDHKALKALKDPVKYPDIVVECTSPDGGDTKTLFVEAYWQKDSITAEEDAMDFHRPREAKKSWRRWEPSGYLPGLSQCPNAHTDGPRGPESQNPRKTPWSYRGCICFRVFFV